MAAKKLRPTIIPLASILFGEMSEDITREKFIERVFYIFNTLFSDVRNIVTIPINTPLDWVTVQFLGLFFDNKPSCVVDLNVVGLGRVELIKEVMEGLKDSTLNILGVWGLQDEVQVDVLKAIAEIHPKKAKIISNTPNVAFLKSFIESLTHPDLQTFVDGSKIDVMLVMDLAELNRHRIDLNGTPESSEDLNLHQREAALIEMFKSMANLSVPDVWNIQLQVGHFEGVAYGI